MSEKIAIIGAGEIGQALGKIFADAGHEVGYWDKDENKLSRLTEGDVSLPDLVGNSAYIFLCVPSQAVREALLFINQYVKKGTIVVSLAKGIEFKTKKMMDEVIISLLPRGQEFALLGGPLIAEEIGAGKLGCAVIASSKEQTQDKISRLFVDTNIVCEKTKDVSGVALCGVMKNIYAVGFGVLFGLGAGDNVKGYYASVVMDEMIQIGRLLSVTSSTVISSAGLGDFISTGLSENSANHVCGLDLTKNQLAVCTSEGFRSVEPFVSLLGTKAKKFKILTAISKIVFEKTEPRVAFAEIMR